MHATILDNSGFGLGDLMVHLWLHHSARAARVRLLYLNPGGRSEVALVFGVDPRWLTSESGAERQAGIQEGKPPGSYLEERRAHAVRPLTRFEAWARYHRLPSLVPVRPPYRERAEAGEWAEKVWHRAARGDRSRSRVAVFPASNCRSRTWPPERTRELVARLQDAGHAVVVDLPRGHEDLFPTALRGHGLERMTAVVARADRVVSNDSGPAHVAGTLGVPTLAICGPTKPEVAFGHMGGTVVGVATTPEAQWCVGCHFRAEWGFRPACVTECEALARLPVEAVLERFYRLPMGEARPAQRRAG